MLNRAGQTDLETLRQRQQLALALSQAPQKATTPIGAGLEGLAKILAARNANRLSAEAEAFEKESRGKDLTALGQILSGASADPAMLSDPRLQELAIAMIG